LIEDKKKIINTWKLDKKKNSEGIFTDQTLELVKSRKLNTKKSYIDSKKLLETKSKIKEWKDLKFEEFIKNQVKKYNTIYIKYTYNIFDLIFKKKLEEDKFLEIVKENELVFTMYFDLSSIKFTFNKFNIS
jgi:hypothetical protein